jgi:DNA invertase Pin-like site-specific DNA recombinase
MNKTPLTNRPKAYSYLRFSTPEQERGDSFRRQTQLAADYAARHGLDLDTELSFQDLGVSAYRGANAETGRLGDFLEAVRLGAIARGSYLLVESLDRLSRNKPRKAVRVLERICEEGIVLVTLSGEPKVYTEEMLDDDPMTFMWAFMVAIRANEESATKARRVKAAWANKRAGAHETKLTALAPSWLTLSADKKTFTIEEDKAAVVRRIFDMTLNGVGQNKIAETLNREGVPVFGRGKRWHRSFVAKLLSYEGVIGTYEPCTIEYVDKKRRKPAEKVPGYYPAIIDERAFRDVQARLAAKAPRGRHANGKAPIRNIFAGIARCPLCDGTMTLVSKDAKRDERYLVCAKAKAGAGCTYKAVRYSWVERAVIDNTGAWAGPGLEDATDSQHHTEISKARSQIDAIGDAIDNILSTFGAHGSPAAAAKVREYEAERDAIEATIATLEDRAAEANGAIVEARIASVMKATADGEDRGAINLALKTAVERVVIDHTSQEARFHWRHGPVTSCVYGWREGAAQ